MREVGGRQPFVVDLRVEMASFAMRPVQERFEKSEFVHHLERRGVDGVAAEVSQEFSMTTIFTPARARRKSSTMPAGPPPTIQHRTCISWRGEAPCFIL